MSTLRSLVMWLGIVLLTGFWFSVMLPVALIAWPFDRKRNAAHYVARTWARQLLFTDPGCTVIVEGEEQLEKIGGNGAAVLCANHQSQADIVALYYLGHPFKWISKREMAYIPVIGWGMVVAGYIFLKRGDKESIRRCMEKSCDWLREGVSIMMFPEGTRTPDGRLKAFKDGAFRMSVDTGRPVVPIALHGTKDLAQKGSWKFASKPRMVLRVGPPIPVRPGAARDEEITRLRNAARGWILSNMAELAGVPEAALDASSPVGTMISGNNPAEAGV